MISTSVISKSLFLMNVSWIKNCGWSEIYLEDVKYDRHDEDNTDDLEFLVFSEPV